MLPGSTHATGDRGGISGDFTDFPPQTGPCVRSKGLRMEMNRTKTSPDSVVSSLLQRIKFFIRLYTSGSTHAAGDRGGISGDKTNFSSTNGSLRAVHETQEGDESHDDLTRQCGKFPVVTLALISPGSTHAAGDRGGFSGDLTDFASTNGALRAVKGSQEGI
jgi:hypothetical protein